MICISEVGGFEMVFYLIISSLMKIFILVMLLHYFSIQGVNLTALRFIQIIGTIWVFYPFIKYFIGRWKEIKEIFVDKNKQKKKSPRGK